jgi:hypothetical protein
MGRSVLVRPCRTSFVTIPRIEITSTMILTMISLMAAVGWTFIYASRRLKKNSIRPKRSIRASLLARTSLIALEDYGLLRHSQVNEGAHLQEDSNSYEYRICRWEHLWSHTSEGRSRAAARLATYHSNAIAEGGREREQDIHSGIQPLCPLFRVVGTLRLIKILYLGS